MSISRIPQAQRRYELCMPVALAEPMRLHSKRIPGCPRPDQGSEAHFIRQAVVEKLERCGVPVRKILGNKINDLLYRISSLK